jgi:hypothetical protein
MVFYNLLKRLVAGLGSLLPAGSKITLGNQTYTLASLVAAFANYISLRDAVSSSKSQYQVAVKAAQAAQPGVEQLVSLLGAYFRVTFGPGSPQLEQLGLLTGKRKVTSALVKAGAVATALATKADRGIKGKVQRSKIPSATKVTVQLLGANGQPVQSNGSVVPAAPSGGGNGSTGGNTPQGA